MDYQPLINRDYKSRLPASGLHRGTQRHHYWLGLAAIPIIITSLWSLASERQPTEEPPTVQAASPAPADTQKLALAPPADHLPPEAIEVIPPSDALQPEAAGEPLLTPPEGAPVAAESGHWRSVTVKAGDSMARIFQNQDLSAADLHQIVALGGPTRQLTRIHPGDELRFRTDGERGLVEVRYEIDELTELVVRRGKQGFEAETIHRIPEPRLLHAGGVIDSSLFLAGQKAGLSDGLIMELAAIFGWDIDFALDIREGDRFNVLYEHLYIDGEFIGHGNILAAEFVNQGRTYKAVRYKDAEGRSDYYSPDGKSMRKAFLRTPVSFSRISSRFSLGRKHPILNRIRAHKGVDYAAPHGTPVKATGAGKVIFAGNKGGYGKTLIVQHGTRYTSLYAHLSRFSRGLKTGSRVQQGQAIGYVGSTGLATGPHLHYEFRVNGVHRNPLTVKLPDAEPIQAKYRDDFLVRAQDLVAQLETRKSTALALQAQ